MKLDTMMEAIEVLARERGVAIDTILDAFANALVAAYKRSPGAAEEARVTIDDVADWTRAPAAGLPCRVIRGGAGSLDAWS